MAKSRNFQGNVTADDEALVRRMREDLERIQDQFHDAGNPDAITGWRKPHEKTAWMLRSRRG